MGAEATVVDDREHRWPKKVRMDGFVYGSLRSDTTSPQANAWPTAWRGSVGTPAVPRGRPSPRIPPATTRAGG